MCVLQILTVVIHLNRKLTSEQVSSLATLNSVTLIINFKLNFHPMWQNTHIAHIHMLVARILLFPYKPF